MGGTVSTLLVWPEACQHWSRQPAGCRVGPGLGAKTATSHQCVFSEVSATSVLVPMVSHSQPPPPELSWRIYHRASTTGVPAPAVGYGQPPPPGDPLRPAGRSGSGSNGAALPWAPGLMKPCECPQEWNLSPPVLWCSSPRCQTPRLGA